MQILHPFVGSPQQYAEHIADPEQDRLWYCPQCQARQRLWAHGFYCRTLVEIGWEGSIRVRRFLCRVCRRTVSLLPQFALPYLRCSVVIICQFLCARLLEGRTLIAAAVAAEQAGMPYQRGQFWVRRFRRHAEALVAVLADRMPATPTAGFVTRALQKIRVRGAIASHRFLLGELRVHLLGWPLRLAPAGRRLNSPPALAPPGS